MCVVFDQGRLVDMRANRKMVAGLAERASVRLLKHVVRCYHRLSENIKARDTLRTTLPPQLRDNSFGEVLKDDPTTKKLLAQLMQNLTGQPMSVVPMGPPNMPSNPMGPPMGVGMSVPQSNPPMSQMATQPGMGMQSGFGIPGNNNPQTQPPRSGPM